MLHPNRPSRRLMLRALAGALLFLMPAFLVAALDGEVEPNNTPATANPLSAYNLGQADGAVVPAGDLDYFSIDGVNTLWGFVAILDTSASTASRAGALTAYRTDGATVLQSDAGSWVNGSVIAWQAYVDGSARHYLRVGELGGDQPITSYRLRYYPVAISLAPEWEPNDTPAGANPASKTNLGAIGSAGDVDCFAFWGEAGSHYAVALNADPEGDGGSANFALALYAPNGALLGQANAGGAGNNELIDEVALAATGAHTYCVSASGPSAGPTATYLAGILEDGYNYFPPLPVDGAWSDPRPGRYARIGDEMTFALTLDNPTSLSVPGEISVYAFPNPDCMTLVSAPGAANASASYVAWHRPNLAPHETFSASFTLRATAACSGEMSYGAGFDYFGLGTGSSIPYTIGDAVYLPALAR